MNARPQDTLSPFREPPGEPRPGGAGEGVTVDAEHDDLRAFRAIAEGTAHGTGQEFFRSLVRHLASAIDVHYAVVAEPADVPTRVRTIAFWARDRIADNMEYDLAGTPCDAVARGGFCHIPRGVRDRFPRAKPLVDLGIESYLGVPFLASGGAVLGHLAVFDERPLLAEPRRLFILRTFAARATTERERMRAEGRLQESERRYRELYQEAPTAYISVGRDGRLLSVNGRATQLLGRPAEELVGTPVLDVLADTPGGKPLGEKALCGVLAGEEVAGLELEMRRKDGSPLWVSLWMRPIRGDDGRVQAGHSICVDITDRVLAEQEKARLQQHNLYLQEEIKAANDFEQLVGRGPALAAILEQVRRVAPTDASVLITGETGTGKELIARAVHSGSGRQRKPLIKVNCAALPAGLVESELFGHEKGAFSGAIARRIGRFELAHGGTLFLDEIGELPPETQAKLLRVLQERELERVGGSAPIPVDVRVIAATNRDLTRSVREGTFREDLFYRLNVFPIHLPPLRERPEDIPLLVTFLVNKFAVRIGKQLAGVSRQTLQRLLEYPWPGNVRELMNVLERAVILAPGPMLDIAPDLLPAPGPAPADAPATTLQAVERDHILAALGQTGWVIDGPRGAAKVLGLHPNTLRNRMKKHAITRPSHHIP
jgi:PAS domain S-box-containing protein